jgi:hypothetical protein
MCRKLLKKLSDKTIWKTFFGVCATGILGLGIVAFIVNMTQWNSDLRSLLYIIIIPILIFVYIKREKLLYIINAALIAIIGIIIIIVSFNKCLVFSLPWDPSLLGVGVSIIAMAFTFLSFMFPPKTQNSNNIQITQKEYQNLGKTLSKLEKDISLTQNNFKELKKVQKEIIKKITNIKVKVVVQKGKK